MRSAVRGSVAFALGLCLLAAVACGGGSGASVPSVPAPTRFQSPVAVSSPSQAPATVTLPVPAGRAFYVAANEPNADDANNGLYPTYQGGQDGPWLTIGRAAQAMTAGDIAYVRAGTYDEAGIRFAGSGAPGAPIVLTNYQSEQVIVDGAKASRNSSGIEIAEGGSHYVIQGLTIRHMPRSGIATDGDTTQLYQDITIRDCVLHDNGLSGIRLAAVDGFLVENVEAHHNAYYGLDIISSDDGRLSPGHGAVQRSSFHDHTGKEGHGLAINQGHDITVSDSRAYHNSIHGFDVSDWPKRGELSHDIVVERNVSYDNGVAGFSMNSDSHHLVYRNNVAWRNGADWAQRGSSSGFLCYEGCWHVEFYNNVSVENTDAGFWVTDAFGSYSEPEDSLLVLKNNIAYGNGRADWRGLALVVEGTAWQVEATYNDWGGASGLNALVVGIHVVGDQGEAYTTDQVNGGAFGEGTVSVDPRFVDLAAGDFHLQPGSPLIDAGTDTGIPFCGTAPDMGAFEVCP
jgi:Right handed beta helix region